MRFFASLALIVASFASLWANETSRSLPVRGLAIAAPNPASLSQFIEFVETELVPRGLNTLVLRIDYRFAYTSHPELQSENPLTLEHVKRLVECGRRNDIELIPQINLLGHQSWAETTGRLLAVYPEFDETPHVKMPETYEWPNEDGLYCKSYCPLHPDVHDVVFALVDELMEAFEASSFHAGMDEVFYIGDERCPRCAGKNKAKLFADEVTRVRDHLAASGRSLWIWGDRLLNADTTGLGMWEASANDTHPAIDLIPKDVVICDWHYERAEATPPYFALKGFHVLACPWNKPQVGLAQLEQALSFRKRSNPVLAERHLGILLTYWSSAERFMEIYADPDSVEQQQRGPIDTLNTLFPKP
ncbi:family 20 glycosylhydrolase [Pelagicoccus sp. SDUM812003]|uniref:family 20 glycosylhydrolase n=1 Tax=Pelagicoccus sp. SDUM812003 TaxID=3041267 RepID=UPI00280D8E4F|nr:family 20 glycosylhydrolase [Pelagicoccus sp. SDUM812003]MDQ8202609.1 family 20 glycosylhydrolase [Pelagicoccus sp. SDUM812003]